MFPPAETHSAVTLRSLVTIVEDDPSLTVVGAATNGIDAIQQVRGLRPDVVVIDLYLSGDSRNRSGSQTRHVRIRT